MNNISITKKLFSFQILISCPIFRYFIRYPIKAWEILIRTVGRLLRRPNKIDTQKDNRVCSNFRLTSIERLLLAAGSAFTAARLQHDPQIVPRFWSQFNYTDSRDDRSRTFHLEHALSPFPVSLTRQTKAFARELYDRFPKSPRDFTISVTASEHKRALGA